MAKEKTPKEIERSQRRSKALEMRKAGFSYEQISMELGVTKKCAFDYVEQELASVAKYRQEQAETLLQLELLRLDEIIKFMWVRAQSRNDPKAVEQILKAMERKARYLGLDAPEKKAIDIQITKLNDDELQEEATRLGLVIDATTHQGVLPCLPQPASGVLSLPSDSLAEPLPQ